MRTTSGRITIAGNTLSNRPPLGSPSATATATTARAHATGRASSAYHARRLGRVEALARRRRTPPSPSCHAKTRANAVGPRARTNGTSVDGTPPSVAAAARLTLRPAKARTWPSPPVRSRAAMAGSRRPAGVVTVDMTAAPVRFGEWQTDCARSGCHIHRGRPEAVIRACPERGVAPGRSPRGRNRKRRTVPQATVRRWIWRRGVRAPGDRTPALRRRSGRPSRSPSRSASASTPARPWRHAAPKSRSTSATGRSRSGPVRR